MSFENDGWDYKVSNPKLGEITLSAIPVPSILSEKMNRQAEEIRKKILYAETDMTLRLLTVDELVSLKKSIEFILDTRKENKK